MGVNIWHDFIFSFLTASLQCFGEIDKKGGGAATGQKELCVSKLLIGCQTNAKKQAWNVHVRLSFQWSNN